MYYVYSIKVNDVIRYIGFTDNLNRRWSQHRLGIAKSNNKLLYNKINELEEPKIEMEMLKEFTNKGDAKRWEAYLILRDYFSNKMLYQSFPISFKYF